MHLYSEERVSGVNHADLYAAASRFSAAGAYVESSSPPATDAVAAESDELCELVDTAASDMHQPMVETPEESWWVCAGQQLAANCKEILYDGEITVACAY